MIKELRTPFILAPLAGITDATFRRICCKAGAALTCSEMISAKGLCYGDKNTEKLLTILPGEGPVGFQIFGCEPDYINKAVKILEPYENAYIDINMGCPVPKIVKNGEGSAILKDPVLAGEIMAAAVSATKKPVSAKIRMGWDESSITAVPVARALEKNGASFVTVHGRTREQFYSGSANWAIIREVKDALTIPVVGNGDVTSYLTAEKMMKETGCDGVMVGRAALGNPWLFGELNAGYLGTPLPLPPTKEEKIEMMITHLKDLCELKGEYAGVREMRKHAGWYLKGLPGAAKLRGEINAITTFSQLESRLLSLGD